MNESRIIKIDRRCDRAGPGFRSTRDYKRHVESECAFHLVRATDVAPGSKTWREKRFRSGSRVPFRTEIEAFQSLLTRSAEEGGIEHVERAADEVWDAVVQLTRLVSRLVTDARIRANTRLVAAQSDTGATQSDTGRAA